MEHNHHGLGLDFHRFCLTLDQMLIPLFFAKGGDKSSTPVAGVPGTDQRSEHLAGRH